MNYSKIYAVGFREFRYNYDNKELEYISDIDFNDDYEMTHTKTYSVLDSIGLDEQEWEANKTHWLKTYYAEINDQASLLQDFI